MDAQFDFVISIPADDEPQQPTQQPKPDDVFPTHNALQAQFSAEGAPDQQQQPLQQTPLAGNLARRGSRRYKNGGQFSRAVGGSIVGGATNASIYGASTVGGGDLEEQDANAAQLLLEEDMEERLLSHVGRWDRRFVNEVIEAEFLMYFSRSRLPSFLWVILQMVLIIAMLVSGSPEQPEFVGLGLASLFSMAGCVIGYGYLLNERSRLNKAERQLRPYPSPLSAAADGGQDKFPDVWFRSEVLLATNNAWRNALRRNALHYERVTLLLAVSYALLLAGTIWLKASCDSKVFWGGISPSYDQIQNCRNSILFEASFISSLCFFIVVTPQRVQQLMASLGVVYIVAMLCPLFQGTSTFPQAAFISLAVLYTLTSMITVVCVYFLEEKKRDEFRQVVWSCAVAEQSQSLRRQETRLTKAAFPFDVDAFLWEQEQDNVAGSNSVGHVSPAIVAFGGKDEDTLCRPQSASLASHVTLLTRSIVIAESVAAVVCVTQLDRFYGWTMSQSPKYIVSTLQTLFTAIDELTAVNMDVAAQHHHDSLTSPMEGSWGTPEMGGSISSTTRGRRGGTGNGSKASSVVSMLFSAATEKVLKSTFGDAFLVVAFPLTAATTTSSPGSSTNNRINQAQSANPLALSTTNTTNTLRTTATTSLMKRMIQFSTLCIVNGNDTLSGWNAKRDPDRLRPPPPVLSTVSSGRVVAAASGGPRGVHVHFSGEPISDALHRNSLPRQNPSNNVTAPGRPDESQMRGLCVVVRSEVQSTVAIDTLKDLGCHRAALNEPFTLHYPFGLRFGDMSLSRGTAAAPADDLPSPPLVTRHQLTVDVGIITAGEGVPVEGGVSLAQQQSFSSHTSAASHRRITGIILSKRVGCSTDGQLLSPSATHRRTAGTVSATPQKKPTREGGVRGDVHTVPRATGHESSTAQLPSTEHPQPHPTERVELLAASANRPPPACMDKLRSMFGFVIFNPFPEEAIEAQFISESRAFNSSRLRFVALCGILVAAILITAETVSVLQDMVVYDDVMRITLKGNGLIWFVLCAVWCVLILVIAAVFDESASTVTYYVLFVLYATCYIVGVSLSPTGSIIHNSPVVWLMLLDALSVIRPPWEHVGIAVIPDTIFLAIFLVRNQRKFVGTGLLPTKLSRAFTAQLVSTHILYLATRVIHERMERSFFATRQEAAEYTRQVERHVLALDDIIRTIAPDKRVARELSRTLHRLADTQCGLHQTQPDPTAPATRSGATPAIAKQKVSVLASSVHDSCLLLVRFSSSVDNAQESRVTERDFLQSKCLLHSALLHFVDSQEDAEHQLPEGGHQSFFVLDHLDTLGATVVCNTGPPLVQCLRMLKAVMARRTKHTICTAIIGSGVQIGAVVSVGAARFDIYGSAIVSYRQLIAQLLPGSIIATSRFRLYEEYEIHREAILQKLQDDEGNGHVGGGDDQKDSIIQSTMRCSDAIRFSLAGGISTLACFVSV